MKPEIKAVLEFFLPFYIALVAGIAAAHLVYYLITGEEL